MYKKFFGLRENPFNVNPDPRYLFFTHAMEEAMSALTYGIDTRKGFLLLTGEVGTGKTTLLNRLLDWLRERNVATAFVFNSHLNVNQLFDFILNDFEIPCEERSQSMRQIRLNEWLLERYREGQSAVLIVDEAQHLSFEVLEEIRMLTNLETATEKLLQIVLSGQPELEEKLKLPQLRQLRQRITIRTKTRPLTLDETRGYITERLRIAGGDSREIYSRHPQIRQGHSKGHEPALRAHVDQRLRGSAGGGSAVFGGGSREGIRAPGSGAESKSESGRDSRERLGGGPADGVADYRAD